MTKEFLIDMIKLTKTVAPEKTIVESLLDLDTPDHKLKTIGYVKDIKSNFKNELFDEIYEDENGIIIDLRIFEENPSEKEIFEMAEYWIELQKTFKKLVQPHFLITGEKK